MVVPTGGGTNLTLELVNNLTNLTGNMTDTLSSVTMLSSTTAAIVAETTSKLVVKWNNTNHVIARYTKQPWSDPTLYPNIIPGIWQTTLTPNVWTTFQVIHTLMTVFALATNCISLVVVYGIVSRLTPHLQILTSLAFADMLAPWAIMTMYFPASSCQDEIHSALLLTSHNAASLSLLTLALCHNIATFRPLNYDKIVTQKRLWIVINTIWITSILSAHVHFLAVLTHHQEGTPFCIQVLMNTDMALTLSSAITGATGLVCALIYIRIMTHLRPIRLLADPECESRKSTTGVVTAIIITVTFLLTWIPYLITKFIQVKDFLFDHRGVLMALAIIQIFILLNTISNPIVYGLRLCSMQTGYLGLYHKCRGCVLRSWNRVAKHGEFDDLPSSPLNPIESIC